MGSGGGGGVGGGGMPSPAPLAPWRYNAKLWEGRDSGELRRAGPASLPGKEGRVPGGAGPKAWPSFPVG